MPENNGCILKDGNKVITYSAVDLLTNKKVILKTIKHSEDIGVNSKEDLAVIKLWVEWTQGICTNNIHKKYQSLYFDDGVVDSEIKKLRELTHPNKTTCIFFQILDRSFIDLTPNLISKRWNFDPVTEGYNLYK